MNKEKFKELRSQINIPLAEAMNLLKQHDENLELCIKVFHQKNIEKICKIIWWIRKKVVSLQSQMRQENIKCLTN